MSEADRLYTRRLESDRAALQSLGTLTERCGVVQAGRARIELHCDFGPPGQDKTGVNQDFALAWHPHRRASNGVQPDWAIAVADGLTSAYWSERAAAIVCLASVRALVAPAGATAHSPPPSATRRAAEALDAAAAALAGYAGDLRLDPDATRPKAEIPFLSTWKYMLGKGTLLRTTLTLAWFERGKFALAAIGDGGGLWHCPGQDAVLAQCDLETEQVNSLGPLAGPAPEWDAWAEQIPAGSFQAALFTDGIGRGLGHDPASLWSRLGPVPRDPGENRAQDFIARVCREEPLAYADNLTLVLITCTPVRA